MRKIKKNKKWHVKNSWKVWRNIDLNLTNNKQLFSFSPNLYIYI